MNIIYNGQLLPANAPIITADNRGLKYGDGLFETMKFMNGTICLVDLHMERLLNGLSLLQFPLPPNFKASLSENVALLCKENKLSQLARVRLTVFRGEGGPTQVKEPALHYIIQATELPISYTQFNGDGIRLGIYKDVEKSCDILANLKTNNYLPYIMAALYAKTNKLDDCIILNTHGRVCDTTIANIFGIQGKRIITPALSEGCVAGVMRTWLLKKMQEAGYELLEKGITMDELKDCDEIFLTNVLVGIKPVKHFDGKDYRIEVSSSLYNKFMKAHPVH